MTITAFRLKTVMTTAICGVALGLTACNKPAETAKPAADKATASSTTTATTATTGAAKGKKIRIATEGGYAPFNFSNPDGSLGGFDVDVARAACKVMEADCTIVAQDWDGILPGLIAKKYDAIASGMSVTPERSAQVDFSTPYFKNTMVWLAPTGGKFNLQNISGFKLGSQRSTTLGSYLQDKYGKTNDVKLYDKYDNAYLDLKSSRLDAVLAEKVPTVEWLKKNGDKFGLVGNDIDNNDNIAIAVRKDDPLKAEFNSALATLKANGELANLEKKYFGDTTAATPAIATATATSSTPTATALAVTSATSTTTKTP